MTSQLTLGPVLYNWPADAWRDFYLQVADEAPVGTVFLGEVVCSKRAPLVASYFDDVVARLERAGKKLVFSTLAEVTSDVDRRLMKRVATSRELFIEANDVSALWYLDGRAHAIGPYMSVYNEDTLSFFAGNGARSICLPPELPASGVAALGTAARELGIELEMQIYGRMSLALSARCYHARAHDRTKDSCQFICDRDPDGMVLHTLEGRPFLAINGIQTQSYTCLNLANELDELAAAGINRFRISPQNTGTVAVAEAFLSVMNKEVTPAEVGVRLHELGLDVPFSNGFYHQKAGFEWHP